MDSHQEAAYATLSRDATAYSAAHPEDLSAAQWAAHVSALQADPIKRAAFTNLTPGCGNTNARESEELSNSAGFFLMRAKPACLLWHFWCPTRYVTAVCRAGSLIRDQVPGFGTVAGSIANAPGRQTIRFKMPTGIWACSGTLPCMAATATSLGWKPLYHAWAAELPVRLKLASRSRTYAHVYHPRPRPRLTRRCSGPQRPGDIPTSHKR